MANTELSILVKLKDEASAAMKNMTGNFDQAVKASQYLAVGFAAAGVAVGAFAYSSVKAAAEAQAQMAMFDTTMKNIPGAAADAREKILGLAAAATKLGFDDEDAANSLAKLYQRTGDLTQATQLNQVAMDLARAKHMDLGSAANMVGMVLSGNGRVLKQYGIDLKESATPMEAINELQGKLKGSAEEYGKTYQGQMEVLNVAFGNLKETVGDKLLPVLTKFLTEVVTPLVLKLIDLAANIEKVTQFLMQHRTAFLILAGVIIGAMIPALIALGITLITVTIPAIIAMAIALAPFIIGGAIIGGIVAGIWWLVENWGKVQEVFGAIWKWIMEKITGIKNTWSEGITFLKTVTIEIFDAIKDKIESVVKWIEDKIEALKKAYQSVVSFGQSIGSGVSGAFNSAVNFVTGKRAAGGPVGGGLSYLVGERGPEIFTPNSSGFITPNGGGLPINVYVSGNTISSALELDRLADRVGEAIMNKLRLNSKVAI